MRYIEKKIIYTILFLFVFSFAYTQQEDEGLDGKEETEKTIDFSKEGFGCSGRYVSAKKAIELRYMPASIVLLKIMSEEGVTIERSEKKEKGFKPIANVKPMREEEIKAVFENEKNPKIKEEIKTVLGLMETLRNYEGEDLGKSKENSPFIAAKEAQNKQNIFAIITVMSLTKSPIVAEIMGIKYYDTKVKPGKTYYYRIKPAKLKYGISEDILDNMVAEVKAVEIAEPYKAKAEALAGEKQLTISWEHNTEIVGYKIKRKDEGKTTYSFLNKEQLFMVEEEQGVYVDKNLENFKKYEYELYGVSVFGEEHLIAKLAGMPRDFTPPISPTLAIPKRLNANQAEISWKLEKIPNDFRGFQLLRSTEEYGIYKTIGKNNMKFFNANETKYIDDSFPKDSVNFYKVKAYDKYGNFSESIPYKLPLLDSIPPAKPVGFKGVIDSLGIVNLSVSKNKEKDLLGYRVFVSNDPQQEFSVLREYFIDTKNDSIPQEVITNFRDSITLKTLSKKIYYKVEAVDFFHNISEQSDVLELKKPDIVPPTSPIFTDAKAMEKAILLKFNLSESEDVVEQYLYRQDSKKEDYKIIATFTDKNVKSYIDSLIKPKHIYRYKLKAKDDSGLYSLPSTPIRGKAYGKQLLNEITDLAYTLKENSLKLKWSYKSEGKQVDFVIYRSNLNGNLIQYKKTDKTSIDLPYHKDRNKYAVKVFSKSGTESLISNVVEVKK